MSASPGRPKKRSVPLGGVERRIRGALLRARETGRLRKAGPLAPNARVHQ